MLSFRCFLDLLSGRDNVGYNTFEEYYPGLRQKIDRLNVSPDKLVKTRVSNVQAMDTKLSIYIPVKSEKIFCLRTYSKGLHAANSNTVEYALRLRQDISHRCITNPNYGRDGRSQRLKCVLCCYKCIKGLAVGKHYREDRTTSKICVTCKVPLCANCD